MELKNTTMAIALSLFSLASYAGEYNCAGGTPAECSQKCVSIGECPHPCAPVYDTTCKSRKPSPGTTVRKIQNCEVISIYDLGYRKGNRHEFCLSRGWNGGETYFNCWKSPGDPAVECPRLNRFYQAEGKANRCEHITDDDAFILHVCGK